MRRANPLPLAFLLATLAATTLPSAMVSAQNQATVPAVCATLPGNAAVSLPLRWSHGTMQVRIAPSLLPSALQGQTITGLRMRRPNFLFEPAYPGVARTLTVRGSFQTDSPSLMTSSLAQNRLTGVQVLFGPAVVASPATTLPGPAAAVGQDVLHVVFTQPLPVAPGTLFLEFEAGDAPLQVAVTNWVDAVWFENGVETGYVVSVGDGSCTTRGTPTELAWNDSVGPHVGGTARFRVTGAPPTNGTSAGLVLLWMGLDPETQPVGPMNLGFGVSFGIVDPGLAGCHQWAPIDLLWGGVTDAAGVLSTTFPLGNVPIGARIGVQAAWIDDSRPGLPFSFSNGLQMVLDTVNVGAGCATAWFPANLTLSPWPAFLGQMPVLTLEY